jgi:hypothetical protein
MTDTVQLNMTINRSLNKALRLAAVDRDTSKRTLIIDIATAWLRDRGYHVEEMHRAGVTHES